MQSWDWLIVGVYVAVAIGIGVMFIYFPHIKDAESAFPSMIDLFLPVGFKGVMVAAMLAAFMSTLDTHLNWGTSYLINDLYRPFINRNASPKHYVAASRVCMLALTLLALLTSTKLTGILDAYKYLGVLTAGVGTVMIARWYWWRVNAWSEISALVCSLLVGNSLALLLPDVKVEGAVVENWFAVRVAINMPVTLAVWVTVTLLTSRKPCPQTVGFYRRMRIAGPGWRRLSESTGVNPLQGELLHATIAWVTSLVFLFGMLFGLGSLVFHEWLAATACLAAALAGGWVLDKELRRIRLSPEGEHDDSDILPTREDGSPITETAAEIRT